MKRSIIFIALLLGGCGLFEKQAEKTGTQPSGTAGEINIIPHPMSAIARGGEFVLSSATTVGWTDSISEKRARALIAVLNESYFPRANAASENGTANSITFRSDAAKPNENYALSVSPDAIEISGSESGMFYGVQSLLQMIPDDVGTGIRIPATDIVDKPRFQYRGIHLDEARHFMGKEFVKKYIRLAARYKLNYFHWHLTDDQGWRIEIKSRPLLTQVGSKRRESPVGKNYPPARPFVGDHTEVKGSYTREDIDEVVQYARDNFVTIIPEIEMPGHAQAALAAYPQFGCNRNAKYDVMTAWGSSPNIFCPSEDTFGFLEDVLGEVIDMFPDSPYIHVGGDEVDLTQWKNSPDVQRIKTENGLFDDDQVVKYFIDRIGKFITDRSEGTKKIICWDDMVKLGRIPNENVTVMSWKGVDVGAMAARSNREVIMTPESIMYFDRPQGDNDLRPSLGKVVTLSDVFNFDPLRGIPPDSATKIIGGQANVWTEFMKTPKDVEYKVFPRVFALAEVLWSPPNTEVLRAGQTGRLFESFKKGLSREFLWLDREQVDYRIPEPFGLSDGSYGIQERVILSLQPSIPNGKVYFTTDGTEPTASSQLFKSRTELPVAPGIPVTVKAIVVTGDGTRRSSTATATYVRRLPGGYPPPTPNFPR